MFKILDGRGVVVVAFSFFSFFFLSFFSAVYLFSA